MTNVFVEVLPDGSLTIENLLIVFIRNSITSKRDLIKFVPARNCNKVFSPLSNMHLRHLSLQINVVLLHNNNSTLCIELFTG